MLTQFRQALKCMATRSNAELIIRRIHYIRPTKEAATQVAYHGLPKGQFWKHSPNWFNCQENEDAYNTFFYLVGIFIHLRNQWSCPNIHAWRYPGLF